MDIVDLREFYGSKLGLATRRSLAARLRPRFSGLTGATVMGLGFPMPYLADCVGQPAAQLAFMLARQGVFRWPEEGAVQSALVDECDLPLLESVVDVALVVHGLELTDAPQDMLREVWRVLAPQGRLFLVVPNRRGVWARFDSSPFGHGQPFSKPQLSALLKENQFSVVSWSYALYFPPSTSSTLLSAAPAIEAMGSRLMQALSGVIIVEAVKQVYAVATGKRARRLAPRGRPALATAPAKGAWRHP
ncbi:class I SAM-dependent methyltransferase [Aestuariivirga sp.]|uniref:class I SAM-dependent methyltransferase n=1 Tax=Aestuariivirga sp. TaxID=2650926 RepID=UPI003BABB1F0|nr:methyltransferase domain-containing protein [Verrucomicrobiota bacterium]